MEKKGNTGFKRIYKATGYSFAGLKSAWSEEAAFRQEVVLASILIPLGLYIGSGAVEKILLAGSCLIVLIVELLNSARQFISYLNPINHLFNAKTYSILVKY